MAMVLSPAIQRNLAPRLGRASLGVEHRARARGADLGPVRAPFVVRADDSVLHINPECRSRELAGDKHRIARLPRHRRRQALRELQRQQERIAREHLARDGRQRRVEQRLRRCTTAFASKRAGSASHMSALRLANSQRAIASPSARSGANMSVAMRRCSRSAAASLACAWVFARHQQRNAPRGDAASIGNSGADDRLKRVLRQDALDVGVERIAGAHAHADDHAAQHAPERADNRPPAPQGQPPPAPLSAISIQSPLA